MLYADTKTSSLSIRLIKIENFLSAQFFIVLRGVGVSSKKTLVRNTFSSDFYNSIVDGSVSKGRQTFTVLLESCWDLFYPFY